MPGTYKSGEFNPDEFGQLKARMQVVEDEVKHARSDRAKLFQAVNAVAGNQQVMNEKLDRNHETLTKFVTQCGTCMMDNGTLKSDVARLKQETSTDRVRRKSQPSAGALSKTKPWEKPIGDLMADIVIGGIKVVGIGAVVALIVWGVGHANI